MADDYVADEEILYRRIPQGMNLYTWLDDGRVKFTSSAFADRQKPDYPPFRPSVDRAKLCPNGPAHVQNTEDDGVVSLETHSVRQIADVTQQDDKQRVLQTFRVNVEPKPIGPPRPSNPAHAEIYTEPDCPDKTVFRKLCKQLALLADKRQWEIAPMELRRNP